MEGILSMLLENFNLSSEFNQDLLQKIHQLDNLCFPRNPWSLEQILSHAKIHKIRYIESKGELIAFLLTLENQWESEILKIGTHPEHQRKKIAQDLLGAHLNTCLNLDVFLEVEESNQPAISFYKKMGFQLLDRRKAYYQNGSDAIIFQKKRQQS